jgi:hypothetical protein
MIQEAATKGLEVCDSYWAAPGGAGATKLSEWKARFASFFDPAQREMAVPSALNEEYFKEWLQCSIAGEAAPECAASPALSEYLRLLEAVVAHGSVIDAPFMADLGPGGQLNWVPTDASGWSRCARTWQGSIQNHRVRQTALDDLSTWNGGIASSNDGVRNAAGPSRSRPVSKAQSV